MLICNNFESSIGGVEILLLSIMSERGRDRSDMLRKERRAWCGTYRSAVYD